MKRIQNVLVPFVFSDSAEGALKMGIKTAQIYEAKLHVLYIESDTPSDTILEKVKEICNKEHIEFNFYEHKGAIHTIITKIEKAINADIIIMGAYGKSGFQQLWVGSNAFKVISTSNCPVITLQNNIESVSGFNKIMLPIDDSHETRQKINWTTDLARGFDSEVLIFCVSKTNNLEVRNKLAIYATQVEKFLTENGVRISFDESYGNNIAEDCIKFAKLHHCDLISIMTEMESTNSFFMGTYAQQLVSTSPIPVLSIHSRSTMNMVGGL